jgi:hypothetical protein
MERFRRQFVRVGSHFPENACRAAAGRVPLRTARTTSKTESPGTLPASQWP